MRHPRNAGSAEGTPSRFRRPSFVRLLALLPLGTVLVAQTLLPDPIPDAPVAIDMARVVALVQDRNLEVKASQQGIQTAHDKVAEARALRLGRVGMDASYLRFDDRIKIVSPAVQFDGMAIAVPPTILAPADNLHVRLEAGLPLYTGGKISNAIAQARAGERAARAQSGNTEAAVLMDAERLYLGVLLGRDVVRLNERALASYQQHLADARVAYREGVSANYDVIRAETAVAEQEKRLIEARNRLQLAEAALRTALDLAEPARIEISGALFDPPSAPALADAQEAAIKGHPGLAALRHKVEALERAERMEVADYLPQVNAVVGKETVTSKLAQTDPNWFAGVQANWSLFEGGGRRARVAEKASEAAQARIELRHGEEQVRLAVKSALLDYESQRSALEAARKAAELAAESLRLATRRFAVNAGTSLEVLDANVALTAAEIGVQDSLFGATVSYLEVHRHAGDIAEVAGRIQK
jgi:outer membrane protein TolC